jgi:hypothetical protein
MTATAMRLFQRLVSLSHHLPIGILESPEILGTLNHCVFFGRVTRQSIRSCFLLSRHAKLPDQKRDNKFYSIKTDFHWRYAHS